jgi:AAA domain
MPSLADHHSSSVTKLLLLGDAKSGKTTSLASLVGAGYKLRILDMDNLLDGLKERVMAECPEKAENVDFVTIRDKYKTGPLGPQIDGPAKAFIQAMKMLDHWKYDEVDLGKPKEWGDDTILVVDSLSRLIDSAYAYHKSIAIPGKSGEIDGRAVFYDAQRATEMALANLTSVNFVTNVIVICHGVYQELPDKTTKILPSGLGKALSPKIPSYFPVYIRYKNLAGKRTVQIETDAMIDLAMPKIGAFKDKSLPIDTGLATIFQTLHATPAKPKSVTLRRA